ncbi:MAG: hypothetical protein ABEK16_05660 [Candidatus Nanohalobium sp.]
MSQGLVVEIDSNNWRKAFEGLSYYFRSDQDLMQAVEISHQTLNDHREGERSSIDVETAERVISVFNLSEPWVDLNQDKYLENVNDSWGERADVEDEVQEYVLSCFKGSELAERADVTNRRARGYQNAESKAPFDLWKDCLREVSDALNSGFYPHGSVAGDKRFNYHNSPNSSYRDPEETYVVEDAETEEIMEIGRLSRRLTHLQNTQPKAYSGMLNRPEGVSELAEIAENPMRNEIGPPRFQGKSRTLLQRPGRTGNYRKNRWKRVKVQNNRIRT